MGLDAYVIPISAYLVHDFEPPTAALAKALGASYATVGPDGVSRHGSGIWSKLFKWTGIPAISESFRVSARRAKRKDGMNYVEWLRGEIDTILGHCPNWNEDRPALLSEPLGYSALHSLRALALRVEFPDQLGQVRQAVNPKGESVKGSDAVYTRQKELGLSSVRFRHLIDHSDCQGFYLPFRFKDPLWIQDPLLATHPWFEDTPALQKRSVGSSVELLDELKEIEPHLKSVDGEEHMWEAAHGWGYLDRLARASVEFKTPICFDG